MALTVGELTGLITLDDSGVTPVLRRTEGAMRQTGQRIGDDAARAGQQAGQQLGDGITRGADGRLRNTRGQFVAAGRRIGDDVGDGAAAGTAEGGDEAAGALEGALDNVKGMLIGGAIGAALMVGLTEALDQGQITGRLQAQMGSTPAVAQHYGQLAGALFKEAIVADFQEGADTIGAIASAGLLPPDATNAQITSIATNAADLANAFDVDVTEAANAAGAMLKNGLAKDGKEAFDLLAAGMTGLGPASDDLMETFTEYAPIFKAAGISGQTAMGLIKQAIEGGWTADTDKIADAFKEFNLRATEGSKGVSDAFKALGLDAKKTGDDVAAGGKRGEKAMDAVLDRLKKLGPDSQEAKQIVSTLFGGPGEDLGAALFALDVDKASDAMGNAAGSADKLGDGLRDNAGAQLTAFKNTMQQNLVEFLGSNVVPALMGFFDFMRSHQEEVKLIGAAILAVVVPALIALGVQALIAGGRMAAAWVMAMGPIGWVGLAIAALVVLVIMYWDQIKAATLGAWSWMSAQISAAVAGMLAAVAWLGQIPGWISGWFSQAKDYAVGKFTELTAWMSGLPGRIGGAIGGLAGVLLGVANRGWAAFRGAAVAKTAAFVSWVAGLPGRISRAIGSMTGLLIGKGKNVVQGLWNGIKGMGGWIKDKIIGWAKSVIPGPVAKALGISSPSRLMADKIGRWIPAGIVDGIEGNSGMLDKTMANLVSTPTPGAYTAAMSGSGSAAGTGTSSSGSAQVVELRAGDPFGDWVIETLRARIGVRGGNVQFVLGR